MERDKHSGKVLDGRYELIRLIDEGGMGSVYLGKHTKLGKRAAVKFLRGELLGQANVVERFYREAQAASKINHPNIIDVFDVGVADWGEPYIVMEYLAGETLSSLLKRKGPFSLAAALGVMEPALRGIGAAHENGIVHRDLKPDNIFLVRPPDSPTAIKLIDFGISKFVESDLSKLTRTGTLLGTPSFMSPEQARGKGEFDHRADIYAMGVIFYLMLTGELPFVGESYNDLIITVLTEPPREPTDINPDFPESVAPLIYKLLEKDPNARYSSCQALIEALESLEEYKDRVEALNALTDDMVDGAYATGDLGSIPPPPEELAATVFAKLEPNGKENSPSAEGESGPSAEAERDSSRDTKSGVSLEKETGPSVETIDAPMPPEHAPVYKRRRSPLPAVLLVVAMFAVGFGGVLFFASDDLFASSDDSDDPDAEVQQIKAKLADLKSAAERPNPLVSEETSNTESPAPAEPEATAAAPAQDTASPERDTASRGAALPEADTAGEADPGPPSGETGVETDHPSSPPEPAPPFKKGAEPPAPDAAESGSRAMSSSKKTSSAKKTPSSQETTPPPEPPSTPPPEPIKLTADDVDALVESKSRAIEACYDAARQADPEVSGKLVIKVTVSDERIWALIMTNELTPEMGKCVTRAIRSIKPPPTIGSMTIVKEILFRVKNR